MAKKKSALSFLGDKAIANFAENASIDELVDFGENCTKSDFRKYGKLIVETIAYRSTKRKLIKESVSGKYGYYEPAVYTRPHPEFARQILQNWPIERALKYAHELGSALDSKTAAEIVLGSKEVRHEIGDLLAEKIIKEAHRDLKPAYIVGAELDDNEWYERFGEKISEAVTLAPYYCISAIANWPEERYKTIEEELIKGAKEMLVRIRRVVNTKDFYDFMENFGRQLTKGVHSERLFNSESIAQSYASNDWIYDYLLMKSKDPKEENTQLRETIKAYMDRHEIFTQVFLTRGQY